jgi:hypothetical protein
MGIMTFQLPAGLPREAARELERSYLAGGPDNMPWPSDLHFRAGIMSVTRNVEESGYLAAPWPVEGIGSLLGASATLMERHAPYHLVVELARGKVNQVRCQAWDWQAGGLVAPPGLLQQIQDVSMAFGHAVCAGSVDDINRQAQAALNRAYPVAGQLVQAYVEQVFQLRHQRQAPLDAALACPLGPALLSAPELGEGFGRAFNQAVLPLSWHVVEAEEASYRWDQADALLDWATERGLEVTAGPLVDFSAAQLPAWLWLWEHDVPSMVTFMCRFVEAAVRRYRSSVRRWQLSAASNWANVLGLSEEELLGLTYRLGEAARGVEPGLELVVGVTQPWGEYMAQSERTYSPFIFAENLIRYGLNLSALDIEVVMGVRGRGTYCRDPLELSRLLDLYALLGVPLRVTMGYPSEAGDDPESDPEMSVGAGSWTGGCTPVGQNAWASAFAGLALCKPYVHGVRWAHFSDADPHPFPHCGLVDRQGKIKPALQALADLRAQHLR